MDQHAPIRVPYFEAAYPWYYLCTLHVAACYRRPTPFSVYGPEISFMQAFRTYSGSGALQDNRRDLVHVGVPFRLLRSIRLPPKRISSSNPQCWPLNRSPRLAFHAYAIGTCPKVPFCFSCRSSLADFMLNADFRLHLLTHPEAFPEGQRKSCVSLILGYRLR